MKSILKKKGMIILIGVFILIVVGIIAGFSVQSSKKNQFNGHVESAAKYLSELNYEQALVEYAEALKIDPSDKAVLEAMEQTYLDYAQSYVVKGSLEKAIEILKRGFEELSSDKIKVKLKEIEKQYEIVKLMDEANKYLENAQYDEAIAKFQDVLNLAKDNADAYLGMIEAYIQKGEYEKALETAEEGYENTKDERLKEKIEMLKSDRIVDAEGRVRKESFYRNGELISWFLYEYETGNKRLTKVTSYGADGEQIDEAELEYYEDGKVAKGFSYDIEGNFTSTMKTYEGDLLVREDIYRNDMHNYMTYEYDGNGNIVKRCYFDNSDNLIYYETKKYNAEGHIVEDVTHAPDGEISGKVVHEYDEKGLPKKLLHFDSDGKLLWYDVREYDDEGHIIEFKHYTADGTEEKKND